MELRDRGRIQVVWQAAGYDATIHVAWRENIEVNTQTKEPRRSRRFVARAFPIPMLTGLDDLLSETIRVSAKRVVDLFSVTV